MTKGCQKLLSTIWSPLMHTIIASRVKKDDSKITKMLWILKILSTIISGILRKFQNQLRTETTQTEKKGKDQSHMLLLFHENLFSPSSPLSTFLSGCHCRASILYAFLIYDTDDVFDTPNILYQSFRWLNFNDLSALISTSRIFLSYRRVLQIIWYPDQRLKQ